MENKYFDTGNIDKINQQLEKIENLINDSNKKISGGNPYDYDKRKYTYT